MSIGVIIEFHFKAGEGAAAIETVKRRLPATRAEDGCEQIYAYQDSSDADRYMLVERWESRAHYDKFRERVLAQSDTAEMLTHLRSDMTTAYLEDTGA